MNDSVHRDVLIFTEAINLPARQRAEYLDRACAGEAKLRWEVEALLHTHDHVGDFLEESPQRLALEAKVRGPAHEKPGDCIGRYKLLEQIGEGGCGAVYMAEQQEPVRRRVALKIIKLGMDTKGVIARFEAERQALALMDHPNIAKVFDAGATESGRPYFVMQLIPGVKITEFCDQHSFPTKQRLKLFVQVCQAVQHAHQKGIIHRDIKPSNILVTTTPEGQPLPVVIDFGIAKATTDQPLTDKTSFTDLQMLIGTPAYMSPEQAELTSVEVDTRTDIYSLGVLLYELLTGSTPFEVGELLKKGLDEIRRVIREQEPLRPSTRLSRMPNADLTGVARHRRSEPPLLIRVIRGDLDWIAMKALDKDRTRRYETANGLAMDVQRFLSDEAVSARPPRAIYKFQKLVLRNKLVFAGVGVIAALLIAGLIVVSASLAKERQAHHETDAALSQAETAKGKAETESVKSRQVTQFLEDMLQGVGPSVSRGRDTTMLLEILDQTAARVGKEMTNKPSVEAELRSLIGRLYLEIGNYDRAETMYRAALATNRKLFGAQSSQVAAALSDLGVALDKEAKFAESENAHQEALSIRRRVFGSENVTSAASLNNLATVLRHQGKRDEAERLAREALHIVQKSLGEDSLEAADILHNLSVVLGDQGKRAESEATARQLLAMRRRLLGKESPLVASALGDLAWATQNSGKLDEAISLEREALTMQQELLGDQAPDVGQSLNLLSQLLSRQGKLDESYALLDAALAKQRKFSSADNPDALATLRSLALILQAEGKFAEAEQMHREALASWRKRGQSDTPQAVSELRSLTELLIAQKKFSTAEEVLEEALTPDLTTLPSMRDLLALRTELKARLGRWQEAATDASLGLALQPLKDSSYCTLAALLIKTQNRPAYEQLRKTLLATFANTTDIYIADQVAKACLFAPPAETDLPVIARLADLPATLGTGDVGAMPFFQLCKALSEYRQGHFAEAINWAKKPLEVAGNYVHPHAYAVLAMAHWRLGEKDEARAMFARGEGLAPPTMPATISEDPGNGWLAWLFARDSLDEAAVLLRSGSAEVTSPGKPPGNGD
jgi:serine/threonine protein kinase/tetratricopeptide (TPR) repeat protein